MTKEELEKEAEEYALDTYEMCLYSDLPYASDRRAREQAYIAAAEPREKRIEELKKENAELRKVAEFGYNKANEWHYVKDGDLPKAYQKCYFIYSNTYGEDNKVIFSESNINVLTGVYAFVIDEETDEETTEPCFYDDINDDEIDLSEVYAWKEIVLPELPKESE